MDRLLCQESPFTSSFYLLHHHFSYSFATHNHHLMQPYSLWHYQHQALRTHRRNPPLNLQGWLKDLHTRFICLALPQFSKNPGSLLSALPQRSFNRQPKSFRLSAFLKTISKTWDHGKRLRRAVTFIPPAAGKTPSLPGVWILHWIVETVIPLLLGFVSYLFVCKNILMN